MNRELSSTEVEFLTRPLAAQLVTLNPSGSPLLSTMWHLFESGTLLFSTTLERDKYRNIQHNAKASAMVLDPQDEFRWVRMDGEMATDPRDPLEFYRRVVRHYLTDEGYDWWVANVPPGNRTVLRLTPRKVHSRGLGGSGVTIQPEYRRRG